MNTFSLTVPVQIPFDFTLDRCPRGPFSKWHPDITAQHFKESALAQGKNYLVEMIQLDRTLKSEALFEVTEKRNLVPGGALGGALLCGLYGKHLPYGTFWPLCLDKQHRLWQPPDGRTLQVPFFGQSRSGKFSFSLTEWREIWDCGYWAVFFKLLPSCVDIRSRVFYFNSFTFSAISEGVPFRSE